MKHLIAIALSFLTPALTQVAPAQDEVNTPPTQQPSVTLVKPEITTRSIFPDKLAYARVYFDTIVAQPYLSPIENDTCKILSIETYQTEDKQHANAKGKSLAIIQFQVKKSGIASLPQIPFESETKKYKTQPLQLIASEITRSNAITLTITPTKTKIYQGEPVRFDLTWDCSIHANALQNLRLNPSFFSNQNIEVAIPRNTQPNDNQVGLPIGGRRAIATRTINPDNPKSLGKITLPIYLRFNKPGTIQLPPTKLEISKLLNPKDNFAQFVAHFNNSLFIPTEKDQTYTRLYTTSKPHTIEVLPLPLSPLSQDFTGIFTPAHINIQINPSNNLQIGQLLELDFTLKSNTPSPFLELQNLNEQPKLDERFLITGDYAKTWHPESTNFKQRIRILSTTIQSIPPLNFTIFNTNTAKYQIITTPRIPLTVKPHQNQTIIPLKNLNATQTLTSNPQGIWYNYPKKSMTNYLQQLLHTINLHFWLLLAIIPIITALLTPLIRKSRKRALNPTYKIQEQAHKAFRKAPENTPQKWNTLLAWLASHFQTNDKAWTFSDTTKALKNINATQQDLNTLAKIHQQQDLSTYTEKSQTPDYTNLTEIAKRLAKLLPLITFILTLSSQSAKASEWPDAQTSFQQAQATNNPQLYSQAALLYQTAAINQQQPATAWYNSGNAWFQAGELGRSIAAYRQAQQLTPWNKNTLENLTSARALVATEVPLKQTTWEKIPLIILKITTLTSLIILCTLTLIFIRYKNKTLHKATITTAIIFITLIAGTSIKLTQQKTSGVIITNKVNSKKGPSYAYANAFDNSLKDGLEFHLIETRDQWLHIQLPDKRQAWIPSSQATLIH